ncbi:MAG: hypothetical protein JW936_07680 [Sedimentisphaerales bacterium]|nr:hypothetical protein [Sedimentisphaerales bacterium]
MVSEKKSKSTAASGGKRTTKTSRRRKPPTPVEEKPLTAEELEEFYQLLLIKRRELLGDVDHMCGEALSGSRHQSSGDLSTMPIHMADVGTDNYEQEFTLGLIESDRQQLRAIDVALAKIGEGTYGICEGTGKQINRARLTACPECRYSIEYARLIEQGKVDVSTKDDGNGNGDGAADDDE